MAVDIAGGALLVAQADGSGGNPISIPLDIGLDHPAGPYAWQPDLALTPGTSRRSNGAANPAAPFAYPLPARSTRRELKPRAEPDAILGERGHLSRDAA